MEQTARQAKWSLGILKNEGITYLPMWSFLQHIFLLSDLTDEDITSWFVESTQHLLVRENQRPQWGYPKPWVHSLGRRQLKDMPPCKSFFIRSVRRHKNLGTEVPGSVTHLNLKHSEISALHWETEMCWTRTNQQNDFHTSSRIQTEASQFCNAYSVGAA